MTNELDSLVVTHLREIHAVLQTVAGNLEEHTRRFDRLEKRFADTHQLVSHTLGLATMNHTALGAHRDAAEARQRRMEARLDGLEHRLAKAEQKLAIS